MTRTNTLLDEAREFAKRAHADSKPYNGKTYFEGHLEVVVSILREHGYSGTSTLVAGYLHDTLEDTQTTFQSIAVPFGLDVAKAVRFCSDEQGANRKERKAKTYARCAEDVHRWNRSPLSYEWVEIGLRAKVADRLANVRTCVEANNPGLLRMYEQEHASFRSALYVPALCQDMWAELDQLLGF